MHNGEDDVAIERGIIQLCEMLKYIQECPNELQEKFMEISPNLPTDSEIEMIKSFQVMIYKLIVLSFDY